MKYMIGSLGLSLALIVGCGPTDDGNGSGNGNNPDGAPGGNPDAKNNGEFVDADPNRPDSGCGLQEEEIELIDQGDPPDVLIVLDRSGSMGSPVDIMNPFGATMWDTMEDALNELVMQTESNIRWGLKVFPTDDMCGVTTGSEVDIDIDHYTEIRDALAALGPDGNTPAYQALQDAHATYQSIPVNPEGQFVLFATDGAPNCDDPDNMAEDKTIDAVTALANDGIDTYVIGFGQPFGLPVGVLDDAAQAGNTARPGGPPYYYEATNASELAMVLEQISGGIITPSCEYALDSVPPDPDAVTVKIDGTPVPRSTQHTNGWDYHPDDMTITFFGSYCDDLESGSITSVEFFFGCPGPQID